jgi:hypothetical protein
MNQQEKGKQPKPNSNDWKSHWKPQWDMGLHLNEKPDYLAMSSVGDDEDPQK